MPSGAPRATRTHPGAEPVKVEPPRERFLTADAYRIDREWKRYEGTAQRDLFRQLRERFLRRHQAIGGRTLEIGPGPGRFSDLIGGASSDRVLLDLSQGMLTTVRTRWRKEGTTAVPHLVRGDGVLPPFTAERFREVAALGNPAGFAGADWREFLSAMLRLVEPGGTALLEFVAGPGERARYLARLPASAVGRLFRAPTRLLASRIDREGFQRAQPRVKESDRFQRLSFPQLVPLFEAARCAVEETIAVAPTLGMDPERLAAVRPDPIAWQHLLELEEEVGRRVERHASAAAVLIALRKGR